MIAPMRSSGLWLVAIALSTGCRSSDTPAGQQQAAQRATPAASPVAPAPGPGASHKKFGESITPGETIALADVLAKPDDFASQTVTVEAKVRRNCTRRGCWMELRRVAGSGPAGVSSDVQGLRLLRSARFRGVDRTGSGDRPGSDHVAAGEVAHLESEGAKFASKQPDGTAREVRMVASGVELWREPT